MTDLDAIPDDPAALRAALLAMRAELAAERALRRGLEDRNERLQHFIRQLQRMRFGRRSEKLDPDQLNLALEDLEQAVAESCAEAEKADPPRLEARAREGLRRIAALYEIEGKIRGNPAYERRAARQATDPQRGSSPISGFRIGSSHPRPEPRTERGPTT